MLKKFINDAFLRSKQVAGIECFFHSAERIEFRGVVLKKEKTNVSILSEFQEIFSINELLNLVGREVPLSISITGNAVIHRKINVNDGDTDKIVLQKVLPNANVEDFYLQTLPPVLDGQSFVSIVRKDVADKLLNLLLEHNYFILQCSFGPFKIENIFPLLNLNEGNFITGIYRFGIAGERIQSMDLRIMDENSDKEIVIGENSLKEKYFIAYGSAIDYFLEKTFERNTILSVKNSNSEFHDKKIFYLHGWSVLISFFLLLLINYFIFDSYSKRSDRFKSEIILKQGEVRRFKMLQNEISRKRILLESSGLLDASKTSFYSDQLALDLPNSILLTDLNIQPLTKKMSNGEDKLVFSPKVILVAGNCKKSHELNDWIKLLKTKKWVNDLAIVNYSQDKEEGLGRFNLELKIK
jgi:hypothetical protein